MDTPEELSRVVREWAGTHSVYLVPGTLDIGRELAIPSAALSPEEFVALIRALQPPVLYLWEHVLDVEGEVDMALEDAGLDTAGDAARAVRRAARQLGPHEGVIARASVQAVVAGVHHSTYAEAGWISRFEEEVQVISAGAAELAAHEGRQAGAEANVELRRLASVLVADPAFHSGRVSFAKRRFLAGELLPEEDDRVLDAAVELAEHIAWLASARNQGAR